MATLIGWFLLEANPKIIISITVQLQFESMCMELQIISMDHN